MIPQHLPVDSDAPVVVVEFCGHEAVQARQAGMQPVLAAKVVSALKSAGLSVEIQMPQGLAVQKPSEDGRIVRSTGEEDERVFRIRIGIRRKVEVETDQGIGDAVHVTFLL